MPTSLYNAQTLSQSPEKWADFVVVENDTEKETYWLYKDTGTNLTHPKYVNRATLMAWVSQGGVYMLAKRVGHQENHKHMRDIEQGGRVVPLYNTLEA